MTRAGNKIPFPMPISGIIADQHPFAIGHGGLSLSQNWWEHDGIFRTRNGIFPADPQRRWYEKLSIALNLVPDELANGSALGVSLLNFDASVSVATAAEDAIVGDHQYEVTPTTPGDPVGDIATDEIPAEPGLPYTGWVFASPGLPEVRMEFLDSGSAVKDSVVLTGTLMDQALLKATAVSPPTTAAIRFVIAPDETDTVRFGPLKLAQAEEVVAWSFGDGYAGDPGPSLFKTEIAHPEDTKEAISMWEQIQGKEEIQSYQGTQSMGIFDGYEDMPIIGRALSYVAQPSQTLPSIDEVTGLVLKEEHRAEIDSTLQHNVSVSYFFDTETNLIDDMEFKIELVLYDENQVEIQTRTIVKTRSFQVPFEDLYELDGLTRARADLSFVPPLLAKFFGLRISTICPTGDRSIVYDNDGNIVFDNFGSIVRVEEANYSARRLGIILEDVKLVQTVGIDDRWYDFLLPVVEHTGIFAAGEYPLNYLPHDYLFEGATESNRIVMASDKSLWKWDDVEDEWVLIGFDLGTVYSRFFRHDPDDEDGENLFLDERFIFEQTDDDGYTAVGAEPEVLTIEIELPARPEGGEGPEPGGWWRYRVNGGDWSSEMTLEGEDPILSAPIEIDFGTPRTIDAKIQLAVTSNEDFADICVIPEDDEGDFENPIFVGEIVSRRDDGEVGESLFHADRDHPVDLRGYDYAQKTWVVAANQNDRITAWDGQLDSKVQICGQNAPFAKTICISGGRVLAGNVRFADPGDDLLAPLAIVYSDTFLGQAFNNWHPELAIRLADTPGEVVKLLELGNLAAACYKTDALYMLVFQTGNNPFRPQLMASNVPGPIGVRACVAVNMNTHFFLAEDGGIYTFDGSYPRNFSQNISRTIQSELDLNYKERAFLSFTPRLNAVLAMYPTKGSDGRVNRGMWIDMEKAAGWPFEWDGAWFDFTAGNPVQTIENYAMGGVTLRMGNVLSALAEGESLQPDFFLGAVDGTTYVMDEEAGNDWGEAILALFRSGITEFGNQDRYSLMKEIEFIINRTNTPHSIALEVWAADHGIDVKPIDHQTIDIFQEGPYFAEIRKKFRFWGYGLEVRAMEQVVLSGAYAAMKVLGRRKS